MNSASPVDDPCGLMENDPHAVVHLRHQKKRNRLGLIFGAGVSRALNFPDWNELVSRIAAHEKVDALNLWEDYLADQARYRSLAALTQMMFGRFRQNVLDGRTLSESVTLQQEQEIKSAWLRIIHEALYRDIDPQTREDTINAHSYLPAFRDIIKKSPLTVNYNFDDTIEKLLFFSRQGEERMIGRGYETIDRPNAQFQKESGVIYHPNGYLPSVFDDGASPDIVFDSDSFQDQLLSAANGHYIHLSNHLFRNTCLLIGLSLDDTTLQSMLRQNAVSNPGHVHYFVHFIKAGETIEADRKRSIFDANFTSYNLYTLFLDAAGVASLANLINMADGEIFQYPLDRRKRVYYIVGSIGAGKSTTTSYFRNLATYDEWIDERLPSMAKAQSADDDAMEIDKWVAEQFRKKNYSLDLSKEGIHLVDRCPLDPLTFPGDKPKKAKNLIDRITQQGDQKIAKGHVIMLECGLDELQHRLRMKHKVWTNAELSDLLGQIETVYAGVEKTTICTRNRDIREVVREVARVIFLAEYRPVDLCEHLERHVEVQHA